MSNSSFKSHNGNYSFYNDVKDFQNHLYVKDKKGEHCQQDKGHQAKLDELPTGLNDVALSSDEYRESSLKDHGQYIYDDANSTSFSQDSQHDEVSNSVIMEVSGELMLGNYVPLKRQIGGSFSSDLPDNDARRFGSGGVTAKYPKSSTRMSDNDWNPYATETDTNQVSQSSTSRASDDRNKTTFVSKATFNLVPSEKHKEPTVMISIRTNENTQDKNRPDKVVLSSISDKQNQDKERSTINDEKRTDLKFEIFNDLRYADVSEELKGRHSKRSQEEKSNRKVVDLDL